ncbi:MAG: hemolysin III family protein [Aerococcus sp.]|nr:hemolysin III family protein [Aerococcus sp.]
MNQKILDSSAYRITSAVFNAVTHGIGLILSIIATVFLIMKGVATDSALEVVAYLIYGLSMCLLYFNSMMYHSLSFTAVAPLFKFFDHSSIYFLIAGTYTPFTLIAIQGPLGWTVFILEWALALTGFIGEITESPFIKKYSLWFYLGMGWLAIVTVVPLIHNVTLPALIYLAVGGILYSVGTYFYKYDDKVAYYHVLWHIFVMLASASMFISIYFYL